MGVSLSLNRPVRELLAERVPVTFGGVGLGLAGGWLLALAAAAPLALCRTPAYDMVTTLASGTLLCMPSAVLALLLLYAGGAAPLAISLVVFPRVFRYVRNLLLETYTLPHVLAAGARGAGRVRVLAWHVFPSMAPQMLALAGVSVCMALGAAVPIEVICDVPGIGQLAWQAALGRDLPLLVSLTSLVTAVTLAANSLSDAGTTRGRAL